MTLTMRTAGLADFAIHLAVATAVASAMVLAHRSGVLCELDWLTLRAMAYLPVQVDRESVEHDDYLPIVVFVGDGAFRAAPDRHHVAQLIRRVVATCPLVLAIDLDLSPGPDTVPGDAQDPLDDALIALGTPTRCPSSTMLTPELILAAPDAVADPALRQKKFRWMEKLCRAGVAFAWPDAALPQESVLRFAPDVPTLGVLAGMHASLDESRAGACRSRCVEPPCEQMRLGEQGAAFLRPDGRPPSSRLGLRPVNLRFFAAESAVGSRDAVVHALDGTDRAASALRTDDMSGRTIFVGDARGRFATPFGERSGAVVHAADFYSMQVPVSPGRQWTAFAVDATIGVGLACVFQWTGAARRRAGGPVPDAHVRRRRMPLRAWPAIELLLLGTALAALTWVAAVCWIPMNLEVHPAPVAVAMFVYATLRRWTIDRRERVAAAPAPSRPAVRLGVAIIVVALSCIAMLASVSS